MGATVTNIGPNSERVDYTAGTTVAELQAAVETALLAHGWELYDAAAGTNAKCYRAVCADGIRYKPIVLDFNSASRLHCKVYESWNASTHVGTNLCYGSDNTGYAQQVNLTAGGQMFVFASNRWALFLAYQAAAWGGSVSGASVGCFEYVPANPEDTAAAGYPCWLWVTPPYGWSWSTNANTVASPRTRNGLTGSNAASPANANYSIAYVTSVGSGAPATAYIVPATTNPWTNKTWVSDIVATMPYQSLIFGKIYGLKMHQSSLGANMDVVPLKIDTNGFYDPMGSVAAHWNIAQATGRALILA